MQRQLAEARWRADHRVHQLFELKPVLPSSYTVGNGVGQVSSLNGCAVDSQAELDALLAALSAGDRVKLVLGTEDKEGRVVELELGAHGVPADEVKRLRSALGKDDTPVWSRPTDWERSLGNVLTPPEDLSALEALRKELEDAKKKIAEQAAQLAAKDAEIAALKRQAAKDAEEIRRLKKLLADREREIADLKKELEHLSGHQRDRAMSRMNKDGDKDKELAHLREQLKKALAGVHDAKDAHAREMAEKDREIERLNKQLHDLQEKLKRALLLGKHPIHQLFELRPELNFQFGQAAGQSLKITGLTNQWGGSSVLNAAMERMLVGRTLTSVRGHVVHTAEELASELLKYSSGDKVQLEAAEDGGSGPKHKVEVELGAYGVPAEEVRKLRKELGVEAGTAVWSRPKEWNRSLDNFLHPFGMPELERAPTPEVTIEDLDKEPCMHRLNRMSRAIFAIEDEEEVKKQVKQEMPESFNLHLSDLLSGPDSDKEQLLALKVLNSVSEPMKRVYRWYMAHGLYNMDRTTFLLTHGQLAMCLTDCKCSPGVKAEIGAITKLVARARNPDGSVRSSPERVSAFRFDRMGSSRLARSPHRSGLALQILKDEKGRVVVQDQIDLRSFVESLVRISEAWLRGQFAHSVSICR